MSILTDMTDDTSRKAYAKYTDKVTPPDYVKQASVATSDDCVKLASACFADTMHRKFPLDSKANCWTSALYFYGAQHNQSPTMKQAEARLERWAGIWGIADDVAAIKQAMQTQVQDVTYALTMEQNGHVIQRCPDHSPEYATKSAEWLYENRNAFPIKVQQAAAQRLVKVANLDKVSRKVAEYMQKLSDPETQYMALNVKVASAICSRLYMVPTSKWGELGAELLKVATDLGTDPYTPCPVGPVLLEAIEGFDVEHGLHRKWGADVAHPVDVVYSYNRTKAADTLAKVVQLTSGGTVDLNHIGNDQLERGLKMAGDEFLDYCRPDGLTVDRSKASEVLPTLPKPEAQRFEQGIKAAGYTLDTIDSIIETIVNANQID